MGFSKPKAVTPAAAPPPVTTTGADVAAAAEQARADQRQRKGYAATVGGTLLQPAAKPAPAPVKKTLLGGN